ncbi:MAG: YlxR family protein [Solirubrobacteraceae bacterium]
MARTSDDRCRHVHVEQRRAVVGAPRRRCIGCGALAPKSGLRRVVLVDGRVQADPTQRLPGRGAYVCDRACAQRALRRGGFARAFRSSIHVDPDLLHSL